MKSISSLILGTLLLAATSANAQTLHEKKNKEIMLKRLDEITSNVTGIRSDLKAEKMGEACTKIKTLFKLYPDHVTDIGVHLDPYQNKDAEIRNDSLNELISLHQDSQNCDQGKSGEYMDIKDLTMKMKKFDKSLKRQRKIIQKANTGFENEFHYDYEF
jgi:chromosome condensin MukBEF ATPase and DNA-binding subunit MukB